MQVCHHLRNFSKEEIREGLKESLSVKDAGLDHH
jgi:hypothetical protein